MLMLSALLALNLGQAQEESSSDESAGEFQLGMRNTYSMFSHDGLFGEGVGGQFRLRLGQRLNTEWYADLISTNLHDLGKRTTGHIGWSVMFYPFNTYRQKFDPYLLAGHCFDYTKVQVFSTPWEDNTLEFAERWSSAVQVGLGTHWNVTDRMDFSLSGQYMMHLGKEVHAELHTENGIEELHIDDTGEEELGLEGHVLITLSVNIKIADLW